MAMRRLRSSAGMSCSFASATRRSAARGVRRTAGSAAFVSVVMCVPPAGPRPGRVLPALHPDPELFQVPEERGHVQSPGGGVGPPKVAGGGRPHGAEAPGIAPPVMLQGHGGLDETLEELLLGAVGVVPEILDD